MIVLYFMLCIFGYKFHRKFITGILFGIGLLYLSSIIFLDISSAVEILLRISFQLVKHDREIKLCCHEQGIICH